MSTVADLNDRARTNLNCRMLFTIGVQQLPVSEVIQAVVEYSDFNVDNDPYGEHDFGVFYVSGQKCFWKFDYYGDEELIVGSADPADEEVTVRVLTVMLAEEY